MTRIAPSFMTTTEHLFDLLYTIQSFPFDELGFVKLNEDSFAMNLVGWHPIWSAARQTGHLWAFIGSARFLGCFDPSKAQQSVHLAQALKEQNSADMASKSRWRADFLAHEVRVVRGRIGLCQHIPLGPLDVGLIHGFLSAVFAVLLNGRPDRRRWIFVDSWQRPGFFERFDRHRYLGFGIQIFEKLPAILDQLTERVFGLRNRERRERDGEPAIRGPQQNCASLFITFILEVIQ